jgi:molybdopterin synthase catalytic subunit
LRTSEEIALTQPSDRDERHADEKPPAEDLRLPASGIAGFEVRVQHAPIDVAAEVTPIMRNPNVGAVVDFVGIVRTAAMATIVARTRALSGYDRAFALEHRRGSGGARSLDAVKIVHRIGRIALGLPVVIVVVASPHRAAAFEACEFIMDFLKTHAPFWKKKSAAMANRIGSKRKARTSRPCFAGDEIRLSQHG